MHSGLDKILSSVVGSPLRSWKFILTVVVGAFGLTLGNAAAADLFDVAAADKIIDEARFGASLSDFTFGEHQFYYEYDRPALNAEVLFSPLDFDYRETPSDGIIHTLLTPRPHLGGTLALENNGISSVYSGLTWHYALTTHLFVEASFGAAVHDGKLVATRIAPRRWRRGLGSRILFRESIAIGAAITENLNIIFQLAHMSHAEFAGSENAGQSSAHLKLGWKF